MQKHSNLLLRLIPACHRCLQICGYTSLTRKKKKDLSAINNMNIEPPSVQIKNDLTWSFCA